MVVAPLPFDVRRASFEGSPRLARQRQDAHFRHEVVTARPLVSDTGTVPLPSGPMKPPFNSPPHPRRVLRHRRAGDRLLRALPSLLRPRARRVPPQARHCSRWRSAAGRRVRHARAHRSSITRPRSSTTRSRFTSAWRASAIRARPTSCRVPRGTTPDGQRDADARARRLRRRKAVRDPRAFRETIRAFEARRGGLGGAPTRLQRSNEWAPQLRVALSPFHVVTTFRNPPSLKRGNPPESRDDPPIEELS